MAFFLHKIVFISIIKGVFIIYFAGMAHRYRFGYLIAGILGFIVGFLVIPHMQSHAQVECDDTIWKCYGATATPLNILNDIIDDGNSDIIQTRLDNVSRQEGMANFAEPQLKISGTLESVRQNLAFYLQWIMFLGLAGAVMFIMINGIRLMVMPLSPSQAGIVKKRIIYVVLGILLMTGFYFIYKIFLSVYAEIFVD